MPVTPGWGWRDNHPIVNVSWDDAATFCEWAGGRLPTEAEWEYAARSGGQDVKYPNGNSLTSQDANFGNRLARTTPVGSYSPNALGLYDMAGNVWEWCADWYDANYYASGRPNDPGGPSSGDLRVLRGGAWSDSPNYLRCALRFGNFPEGRVNNLGFRCAQDAR